MSNKLEVTIQHQSFKSALFPNKEIRVFGHQINLYLWQAMFVLFLDSKMLAKQF